MRIVVTNGPDVGKQASLAPWPLTIGRADGCDLVLTDSLVSGRHLQMYTTAAGTVEIADLNSSNGTWIDGHRVTGATPVRHGSTVYVGSSTLYVEGSNAPPAAEFAAPLGHAPFQSDPFAHPPGRVNAGPIARGNIDMSGENVAGRDLHLHEGFRIRSRMRPAARKLLFFGIALFFAGLAVSMVAMAAFQNEIFDEDNRDGPSSDVETAFAVVFLGGGINLVGIICIVVALVMRREKVAEPYATRRR